MSVSCARECSNICARECSECENLFCVFDLCLSITPKTYWQRQGKETQVCRVIREDVEAVEISIYT